jgi:hypothetical protein
VTPRVKITSPDDGEPHFCFANALELTAKIPDALYTEGYFYSVIPIHHAWVTLPDGTIYDPTLNDQERGAEHYLGLLFSRKFMAKHLRRMEKKFGDPYPSVLVGPDEMYNLDVLRGDFEVAELRESA